MQSSLSPYNAGIFSFWHVLDAKHPVAESTDRKARCSFITFLPREAPGYEALCHELGEIS